MNSGENLRLQRADRRFEARVGETLFREDDGANIAISRNFWRSALRTGPAALRLSRGATAAKGAGDKRLHRSAEQRRRGPAGAARAGRGVARVGRRGATPHLRRSCACRLQRLVCRAACVPLAAHVLSSWARLRRSTRHGLLEHSRVLFASSPHRRRDQHAPRPALPGRRRWGPAGAARQSGASGLP